ncbi:MAG: hypothetical protein LBE36_06690 [Flavobacteriaceae bacterium]|jgi:non-canonical (house-cleaning) NTP pyrophosphatase|nr:hypothetical protein [Flavobacteriaceae bacterium]
MEKQTLGQKRIRVTFNTNNDDKVEKIKEKFARLIDDLQAIRTDEVSKTYDETPETLQEVSGEKLRLIAIAQTKIEEATMWAVKAISQ